MVVCLWAVLVLNVLTFVYLARDHIRTLGSLRQVPGTHLYVMDYYCAYNMEAIRQRGINPSDVEGSLIRAYFPELLVPIAMRFYEYFKPDSLYYQKPSSTLLAPPQRFAQKTATSTWVGTSTGHTIPA